ncbi:metallophosphoesterase [Catenulispora sp. NF23]|uniref:Metallophosphoesterase n=2 Tax=Catenulispora pinistramenti TaxID=2705254 RepID=A0ABS5L5B5_9ACTN|nr:metallophosphoesterase [Catenulispora pinistramenti]MBS2553427.1 metallophosphoesterase [Catenulispora pinistramenti]
MESMRKLVTVPLSLIGAAAAGLTYAHKVEPNLFRLRRYEVPVLPRGVRPLRILQVSDIHMIPEQYRKVRWLRSLAALEPDFVVNTGDNLSHPDGIGSVLDALEPLMELPGAFVMGSNDYLAAKPLNPAKYLLGGDPSQRTRGKGKTNDWQKLRDGFGKAGWLDLTNRTDRLTLPGAAGPVVGLVGVDDPHIRRDDYPTAAKALTTEDESANPAGTHSAARTLPDTDLTIGVVHAPYRRVLDAMSADGLPLILAGHTHGGQLRLPFYGALVTNCDLDRRRASGLSTYAESHLHVSAGCGTSRFAQVRFCCPPEATLLTLTPRS